ncbi:MAG: sulfurtransferase-like selenium metabolism protein YedF, partial [Chitinophagales bacterium]
NGEEELGRVLMKGFIHSLCEINTSLRTLIFMNSGVFLTTEGSSVLESLKLLEEKGVEILSCGTCLDYYHLKDKLMAGSVTNMYTAMEILTGAEKSLVI